MRKTNIYTAIQQKFRNHWPGNLSKTIVASLLAAATYGQGVGINTTTPDPSAALDIQATDKGILIPRVYLQDGVDGTTVPNPANGLIIYNTNKTLVGGDGDLNGEGLYQNTGTPASPNWQSVAKFKLPTIRSSNTTGAALSINNFNNTASNNSAISASSPMGYALKTDGKIQISGAGQNPKTGKVLTSDNDGNATWEGAISFRAVGVKKDGGEVVGPAAINYRVPFTATEFDLNNDYTVYQETPSSTFTAPVSGIYHFDAQITNNGNFILQLVKIHLGIRQVIAVAHSINISTDIKLSNGDEVFIEVNNGTNDYREIFADAEKTFFNGRLVTKIF